MALSTLPTGYSEFWLVAPRQLHLMRYAGQNEDYLHSWKVACGSRFSEESWDAGGWSASFTDAVEWNMAICKRCRPLMEHLSAEGQI